MFAIGQSSAGASKYLRRLHVFHFSNGQKLYRQGKDNQYYLNLLSAQASPRGEYPLNCRSEARIVDGSLYLQVQYVFELPADQKYKISKDNQVAIYNHSSSVDTNAENTLRLGLILRGRLKHLKISLINASVCNFCSGLISRSSCPTEYQITIHSHGNHRISLSITKWLEVGEGKNRNDPVWKSHLFSKFHKRSFIHAGPKGQIRLASKLDNQLSARVFFLTG